MIFGYEIPVVVFSVVLFLVIVSILTMGITMLYSLQEGMHTPWWAWGALIILIASVPLLGSLLA